MCVSYVSVAMSCWGVANVTHLLRKLRLDHAIAKPYAYPLSLFIELDTSCSCHPMYLVKEKNPSPVAKAQAGHPASSSLCRNLSAKKDHPVPKLYKLLEIEPNLFLLPLGR